MVEGWRLHLGLGIGFSICCFPRAAGLRILGMEGKGGQCRTTAIITVDYFCNTLLSAGVGDLDNEQSSFALRVVSSTSCGIYGWDVSQQFGNTSLPGGAGANVFKQVG